MTTYKGIKGLGIQNVTSDAIASQAAGGSWASGGNLNTARYNAAGAGTQTAASLFGGAASPGQQSVHEYYDGSSWTEQGDLNSARSSGVGGGTQTASLVAGGYTTANSDLTETWNGSSWTEVNELNTARRGISSLGQANNAMLAAGGYTTTAVNNTEQWNGTSWTEIAEITTTGTSGSGSGTSTEGLIINVHPSSTNQYWDGSSWTELADTNTSHSPGSGGSQQGSYTFALIFGGVEPSQIANTESWDGTSWTEVADLGTAKRNIRGAGTATSGLASGGETEGGPALTQTEEWSAPATFRQFNIGDIYYNADPSSGVIKYTGYSQPTGTWASGGNMNTARSEFIGSNLGKTSHAIAAGGPATIVEQYDGSSWSEIADVNTSRTNGAGMGRSPNACLLAGGQTDKAEVEEYNGSSWTELSDINSARRNAGQAGTTTAGLIFGGNVPSGSALTELWNGSSWSETGDLNTGRGETDGNGISTSAICVGGEPNTQHVEEWNGSAWSEVSEINVGTEVSVTAGANAEDALNYSGGPPRPTTTEYWNGSSWTETGDLAVGVQAGTGGGTHSSEAWLAGGYGGSPAGNVATTQEWSAGAGLKTLASTNA